MLAINYKTGIAAGAILFAIIQYLKRMDLPARWSDSRRSHHLRIIRENLLLASQEVTHPREWRPFILALSDDKSDMSELLQFSQMIEGKSGIVTAVQIVQGTGYKSIRQKEDMKKALTALITDNRSSAFPLVIQTEEVAVGLPVLFQSYSIGPMQANTLLIHWNQVEKEASANSVRAIYRVFFRSALRNGCNIVMLGRNNSPFNIQTSDKNKDEKIIDVWWRDDNTSRLMILLSYLIKRDPEWEQANIRLFAFETADESKHHDLDALGAMLKDIRIEADLQIVKRVDSQTIIEVSGSSDLVFLPVFLKDNSLHVIAGIKAKTLVS